MLATCDSTVRTLSTSSAAMSSFERPCASSRSTSRSRLVSTSDLRLDSARLGRTTPSSASFALAVAPARSASSSRPSVRRAVATSSRATASSARTPLVRNRSAASLSVATASSEPAFASTRPRASKAAARSGAVPTDSAIDASSSAARCASRVRPSASRAGTSSSSAGIRINRSSLPTRRRYRSASSAPRRVSPRSIASPAATRLASGWPSDSTSKASASSNGLGKRQLGFVPRAAPHQHLAVIVAAHGEDDGVAESRRDLLHPATPLACAIEVPDPLAGVDQVAANELDEPRVLHLARDRRSRRLVQVTHPFVDFAGRHEREPVEREEEHLPGEVADLTRDAESFRGQDARRRRVVHAVERTGRTNVGEHPVLLAERHVLEQVACALEPAARLGRAAEVHAVDGELEGEPRRAPVVAETARQPVASLVRLERRGRVDLGCGGDTEAEEGSRRLLLGECSLKLRPRFLPRPSLERCLTSFERTRDLIFRHTSRVPKSTPDEREGGTGDQAGPDSSDAARRESLLTGELNTLDRSC